MAATRAPMPLNRRVPVAAALTVALSFAGWFAFAYGSAGLVLHAGDCAGRPAVGALVLAWLVAVLAAFLVPPVLLLARGRWRPALVALGIAVVALYVLYFLALFAAGAACGP